MLSIDAYVFINVDDPLCAWAAARGVLVSAGLGVTEPGFVSVWSASLMKNDGRPLFAREMVLEQVRRSHFASKVSRFRGMFCFLDLVSAQRASALWSLRSMRLDNLAEMSLEGITCCDRFDSNWITFAPAPREDGWRDTDWMHRYWSGEAMPGREPIWEALVEGRMTILGTELRDRAWRLIGEVFPDSLGLLEIARAAALVGSDLGNICGWLAVDDQRVALQYLMDMRDASSTDLLERLKNQDAIVDGDLIRPLLERDDFGKTPDLRPYGFFRSRSEMPYVGRADENIAAT